MWRTTEDNLRRKVGTERMSYPGFGVPLARYVTGETNLRSKALKFGVYVTALDILI